MPDGTVLERRDRALISFLFLTGSRETAAISLSLGHIDLEHGVVQFDGRHVDTKFGKSFTTAFFPIGGSAERIVRDWVRELREDHLFSATDPLFPKTLVGVGQDRRFAALGIDRAPWSSSSSAARIFKEAFRTPVSRPSRHIVFGTPWQSCHASTAAHPRTTRPGRRTWGMKTS
jgi:integrase